MLIFFNVAVNKDLPIFFTLNTKWGKKSQAIVYENARLYYQRCSKFGHVILDCEVPQLKEKEKVTSLWIVKENVVKYGSLSFPPPKTLIVVGEESNVLENKEYKEESPKNKNDNNVWNYPFLQGINSLLKTSNSVLKSKVPMVDTLNEGEIKEMDDAIVEEKFEYSHGNPVDEKGGIIVSNQLCWGYSSYPSTPKANGCTKCSLNFPYHGDDQFC